MFKKNLNMSKILSSCLIIAISPVCLLAFAAEQASRDNLDHQVQKLKQEILDINSDLSVLEKDFLYPINARLTVFVSMDTSEDFDLSSIKLKIDDKVIANHLYSKREVDALRRGAVQRLYINSLAPGEHEIVVYYLGRGKNKRQYRHGKSEKFKKTDDAQYVELKLNQKNELKQPEFSVKVWD